MSTIDKTLVERFNVNFCEDYTRQQLQLYAKEHNIKIYNPTKTKLCHEIRRSEFLDRFWKDDREITRFRGQPYDIYLSLLYLKSLNLVNVDIFVPNYIDGRLSYNDLCITWESSDTNPLKINIPSSFYKLLKTSNKRFIVITLGQSTHDNEYNITRGHLNLLIFDRVNKTIERFEPHGSVTVLYFFPFMLDTVLSRIFSTYKYLPTSKTCPIVGPQNIQVNEREQKMSDPIGFCAAWVVWYIEFKFTYQTTYSSREFLDMYLYILRDVSLTRLIRKYSEHVLLIGEDVRNKIVNRIYYK